MLLTRTATISSSRPAHAPVASTPLVRVVDDEPSIQALFTRMGPLGGFAVECHTSAHDLLESLDDERPGCLVLDLVLPDRTGIELLMDLAARGCRLPVVFMSGMARVSEAVRALKLGSVDFIEKPFEPLEMLSTIERAIELDSRNRRAGSEHDQLERRFSALTPRENEVMEEIVQGAANKEVAAKLGLSPKTVEVHRANVMRKTQARSLAELVRMHVAVRA
ncbi:MAG: LuxR C-terminal-related transcriptional regulator [Planctomycetes bacterium]|jgi:FixJ family two-component response regulator|nr:LuxR C-terminal-related transcriptional regulator [Planctomycetota bacterium]